MADVYGVTPKDVSDAVPALFRAGFTATTAPTSAAVATWISAADATAALAVRAASAADPAGADAAAPIAKQYVVAWALARVYAAVYAGNAPDKAEGVVRAQDAVADKLLATLKAFGAQAAGSGAPAARVQSTFVGAETTGRSLLLCDEDLDGGCRRARF